MKKRNFVIVILVMIVAVFVNSCDDDADPIGPTLAFFGGGGEFIDEDVTVEPGAALMFSFLGTKGDNNLKSMAIQVNGLSVPGYPTEDVPNDNYQDTVSVEASSIEGAYTYLFILTDSKDLADSMSFSITVLKTWDPIDTWEDVQLFVPALAGTNSNNCASVDGSTFTYVEATDDASLQSKADFVYYYTTKAIIAAPSAVPANINDGYVNWDTKNPTKFYTVDVTAAQFDDMEDDELIIGNIIGTSTDAVDDLAVDDVVGFETNAGKMGLFKVTELDPGYNLNNYIKISIKVQQTAK